MKSQSHLYVENDRLVGMLAAGIIGTDDFRRHSSQVPFTVLKKYTVKRKRRNKFVMPSYHTEIGIKLDRPIPNSNIYFSVPAGCHMHPQSLIKCFSNLMSPPSPYLLSAREPASYVQLPSSSSHSCLSHGKYLTTNARDCVRKKQSCQIEHKMLPDCSWRSGIQLALPHIEGTRALEDGWRQPGHCSVVADSSWVE